LLPDAKYSQLDIAALYGDSFTATRSKPPTSMSDGDGNDDNDDADDGDSGGDGGGAAVAMTASEQRRLKALLDKYPRALPLLKGRLNPALLYRFCQPLLFLHLHLHLHLQSNKNSLFFLACLHQQQM
jgi:hypothetical protein